MSQFNLSSFLHLCLLCATIQVCHGHPEAIEFECSEKLSLFDRKIPRAEGWLVECGSCDPFDCYDLEGTGLYSPDTSSCCCAAMHNGTITAEGGIFRVYRHRHKSRYEPEIKGSIQHGVYSSDYKPSKVSYRMGKYVPTTTTTTTTTTITATTEPTTTIKQTTTQHTTTTTTTTEPTTTTIQTTTTEPTTTTKQTKTTEPTTTTTQTTTTTELDITAERQEKEETTEMTSRIILSPTLVSELNQNERQINSTSTSVKLPPKLVKIIPNVTVHHTVMTSSQKHTSTIVPVIMNRRAEDDDDDSAKEDEGSSAKPSHAEVMWLVKGLFIGLAFCVLLAGVICAGRRIRKQRGSLCERVPTRRKLGGEENEGCVCYIAMDAAEQSLMFDPETCERPCTMRKQLLAGVFDEEEEEEIKVAEPAQQSTSKADNCQKACEDCTEEHCTTQHEKFAF